MGKDYGLGMANIDFKTGIRYGVITDQQVGQTWYDSSEPYYSGKYYCPKCGDELDIFDEDKHAEYEQVEKYYNDLYACDSCQKVFDSEYFEIEPLSFYVADNEYSAEQAGSSPDIFITRSPYYTVCGYCSPCAPGAGYLMDHTPDCKAYCFGHDWFEDGAAPYLVYDVKTNEIIKPKGEN